MLFFQIYYYILFARIIISFLRIDMYRNPGWAGVVRLLYGLTEPLLAPIRRLVPLVRVGAGMLDLSPIILLVLLNLLQRLVYIYL